MNFRGAKGQIFAGSTLLLLVMLVACAKNDDKRSSDKAPVRAATVNQVAFDPALASPDGTKTPTREDGDASGDPQADPKKPKITGQIRPEQMDPPPGPKVTANAQGIRTIEEAFGSAEVMDQTLGRQIYSGAASDGLVGMLEARLNAVTNADAKAANEEFAKQIGITTIDIRKGQVSLALRMLNHERQVVNLSGALGPDFSGDLKVADSEKAFPNMRANVRCMDSNGHCHTVRVHLEDGAEGARKEAYVLLRMSKGNFFARGERPEASANQLYAALMQTFMNTAEKKTTTNDYFKRLEVVTSEVIMGRCYFYITFKRMNPTGAETSMLWVGSLVKSENSAATNISIENFERAANAANIGGQSVQLSGSNFGIDQVRLVKNDGAGTLLFVVVVGEGSGAPAGSLLVKVSRDLQAVSVHGL